MKTGRFGMGSLIVAGCLVGSVWVSAQQQSSAVQQETLPQVQVQQRQQIQQRQLLQQGAVQQEDNLVRRVVVRPPRVPPNPPVTPSSYHLEGPFAHQNLSLYLIRGADQVPDAAYVGLQEAMERGLLIVHETGNVSQLAVENTSPGLLVFIQAGEIVKGGRQDRVLAVDLVVPPQSGRIPIQSFCVEQGRWQQRGGESAGRFAESKNALPSKALKLAARRAGDQGQVWQQVAETQRKLSDNLQQQVGASASRTSLELSLENESLQESVAKFTRALETAIDGKGDVIGFAFSINGAMNSAEVFGSSALFRAAWSKLLYNASVEALAERKEDAALITRPGEPEFRALFADLERASGTETTISERVSTVMNEHPQGLLFETRDRERNGAWLRRSYIAY